MTMLLRLTAVGVMLTGFQVSVLAQEDFRSVDAGRPIRVEDAYPLKFLEWEWELGSEFLVAEGGRRGATGVLELKVGIARNLQFGVEAHPAWERVAGAASGGVEEFSTHLLFNVNQEGRSAPAVAFRTTLLAPGIGDVRREDVGLELLAIQTKSLSRLRLHLNGGYAIASDIDGGAYWISGLGFDFPIGLFSKSILGDLYLEVPTDRSDARVWFEVGTRLQITNVSVIDLGVTARLDEWGRGAANIGVVFGLSRVFGVPGLVKIPAYPNPRVN